MNPVFPRLALAFAAVLVFATLGRAAPTAAAEADGPPLTARELQQGYRDRVILARPLAAHRASVDAAEAREGIRVRETFSRFRDLRIIELDAADSPDAAIARLRATGRYEFVEPDYLRHLAAEPNDPSYLSGALWALRNTGQNNGIVGADIKAAAAWDLVTDASSVVVAVVDTGVNLAHQDLAGNLWRNPNPTFGDVNGARFLNGGQSGNPTDDNGHGTHVAGTIGAVGNNGLGVTGVAWRVQIMAVKVFPATGSGSVSDIARGVNYAVARGAHIINASYGALGNSGFTQTELAAITAARDAGVIFVAAAGNSAANMDVSRFYPAAHALDNIVTVGNSTRRDELSLSSNFGSAVDLFAPGSEIVSLGYTNTTGTATLSGTSMAAPHVSGALALLKARYPADTYRQLINRLLRGTDPGERFAGRAHTGGRLNVDAALRAPSNRPFNDDFAARPRFANANLSLRSSNAGATAEAGEPAHAGLPAAATLWWEWTAPASGNVSLTTAGSAYDTVLAVYTGTALGALVPVAANDNDGGAATSRLAFAASAGTTYQIAVAAKDAVGGLTLLSLGTTPANDAFANPVVLAGESARVTGANANSGREAGEPRILGFAGGASLWYRWTAPRSGRFQFAAESADFDPLLAVYTGTALGNLALVDANDNAGNLTAHAGSLATVEAVAGTVYLVSVDTKSAAAVGQFTLSLTDSLWQAPVADGITGAPAVARDGTVYFGSLDRSVYAIGPDGARKWTFATGGTIDTASPAVADDGTVYVGSNDGTLYALTAAGGLKWSKVFGSTIPVANSPALAADGTIYLKAGDGFLYALDPADGATRWRFDTDGTETYASPSIAPDGTIYQGSDNGRLYAVNPNGTQKWVFQGDNDIYTVPAIDAAGNVYFGVLNTGKLFSVNAAGQRRWEYTGAALGSSSSPALSPDGATVYFGGYDKKLHAVNTATGAARWTYTLGDEVRASSPAVDANGVIYIGCYDFKVYALNPNGTLKRTWDTGNWVRSSPALAGTRLYVGSNDDKLYAFDIGAAPAAGPWPQFRFNARRAGRAITEAFAIVTPLRAQEAFLGQTFALGIDVTGNGPFTYEWRKDGTVIAGATASTYTVATVTAATAGSYTVRVTGPEGTLTSGPAVVTVANPIPGRLVNLSVRTNAGTGAETLTVGFFVAGTANKPLLARGVGPGLAAFGVTGVLADPQLRLNVAGTTTAVAFSDDWAGAANVRDAAGRVGAFPLAADSRDAALLATLGAGAYTAEIVNPTGTAGIALAELYDLEPTTATAAANRLANISARAQVGTGGDVLIAGFSISGNQQKQILIRGIGPALTSFGLAGALANPRLELFQGTVRVGENDDWGGGTALQNAFARVGAFALANAGSRDAALLVTLAPGTYTVQLSGVAATTGVGLIEIYEMP